nr:MAG TPA: hypothetical protein [Caudoviricetes sp.]
MVRLVILTTTTLTLLFFALSSIPYPLHFYISITAVHLLKNHWE